MAAPKSKISRARPGQRRSHDALTGPTLAVDPTTGEKHRRHHVTEQGYYRGRQISQVPEEPMALAPNQE